MTTPVAAWRVTYTPGEWLVLSGPTMVVVMLPPPALMSRQVDALWDDVVSAGSVDALVQVFHGHALESIPDFAAFFWDEAGLHGMARGELAVVDADSGETVVDGRDMVTWREEALGTVRNLRVGLQHVNEDRTPQLPLVVGAVMASEVHLSTDPASRVHFPEHGYRGVLEGTEPPAVLAELDHEDDGSSQESLNTSSEDGLQEDECVGLGDETDMEPYAESTTGADGEETAAESSGEPELEPTEDQRFPNAPDDEVQPIGAEQAAGTDSGVGGFRFDHDDDEQAGGAPSEMPEMAPPGTGLPIPPPVMPAAATIAPRPEPQLQAQVWAEPCPRGHANARGSRMCRICSAPVDPSQPRLINPPVLACVRSNTGAVADLHIAVVVGRAPAANRAPEGAHLMRVPSPNSDISRSHLLVKPQDWSVIVTDLDSTNGTTVTPVGEPSFVLGGGQSVQVDFGTILDLGDGASLRIEPPRG